MMANYFVMHMIFLVSSFSKQTYLQDIGNPHQLPDGSLAYQNYTGSKNNRYNGPDAANKNNILFISIYSFVLLSHILEYLMTIYYLT